MLVGPGVMRRLRKYFSTGRDGTVACIFMTGRDGTLLFCTTGGDGAFCSLPDGTVHIVFLRPDRTFMAALLVVVLVVVWSS